MASGNEKRWNHNIHYHRHILRAVPKGAQRALDIGCGEGMLARQLHRTVPYVTGIDLDAASIEHAKKHSDDIEYILGDALTHPFESESFDVVTSVATLHHMDAAMGLTRMRELVRPGGALVIVGLARDTVADLPYVLAGVTVGTIYRMIKGHWQHPSPVAWPPPTTYREVRTLAGDIVPGSQYRRHLLFRYSITWHKPALPTSF